MKVVCMCQGGNSRSVACAYLLKYKYGMDALACGWEKNSKATLKMLFEWAEAIVIMQACFLEYVDPIYHPKLHIIDVGPDIWCNGLHPDLLEKVDGMLSGLVKAV